MHTHFSKYLALSIALFAFFASGSPAFALTWELRGYAWESNTGWISFNSKDLPLLVPPLTVPPGAEYAVRLDDITKDLSGSAWSSNIGWITFNGSKVSGCPSGTCQPQIDLTTGNVTGWARACAVFSTGCGGPGSVLRPSSQTGGWDGWISLSGAGYGWKVNISTKNFETPSTCATCFAWGGDNLGAASSNFLGWISMDTGARLEAGLGLTFTGEATGVSAGTNITVPNNTVVTLRWTTTGSVTSCTGSGAWNAVGLAANGTWATPSPLVNTGSPYSFNLTCTDGTSNVSGTVTVNVSAPAACACGPAQGVPSSLRPAAGDRCLPPYPGSQYTVPMQDASNNWNWDCSESGCTMGVNCSCVAHCTAPVQSGPIITPF